MRWLLGWLGLLRWARSGVGIERLREAEHRNGAVAGQIEIVGDDGAEPSRRLRVDARAVEGDQPRAEREGFLEVVRHHQDGHAALAPERADERVHLRARAGIERPERLVEQQHARLARERLRDREPLLHAARERARILVAMRAKPHRGEQGFALVDRLAPRRATQARQHRTFGELVADQHVAEHGEVREHRVALEHDAAVRPRLVRQRRAVEQHRAAGRPLLPEHHAQERALAAARRADDGDEGAGRDLDIDALEHDLVAVFDPHVADRDRAHRRRPYLWAQGNTARDSHASA